MSERITRAFLITDMQSKVLNINTSGATAVVGVIYRNEDGVRRLLVANVGDSRAVLASNAPPQVQLIATATKPSCTLIDWVHLVCLPTRTTLRLEHLNSGFMLIVCHTIIEQKMLSNKSV